MPIYRIDDNKIVPIQSTTFKEQGLLERSDLQALLKTRIDAISPDTLVVAEEFSDWEDSRRSIDLLGIDKDANLVVIELKRTESGDHMELQALRYAAMISTLTFDKLVDIYKRYSSENNLGDDAKGRLIEFLTPDDLNDEEFDPEVKEVKIVLASAGFSKELMASVMWLNDRGNDRGLDIRCVQLRPCDNDGQILLDVQTVIPIPKAEEYQIGIRKKRQRERASRRSARDYYDVTIGGEQYPRQNKRQMMHLLVSGILKRDGDPEKVLEAIPKGNLKVFEGNLDSVEVKEQLGSGGRNFFSEDKELVHMGGKTYVLFMVWRRRETLDTVDKLVATFPELNIRYEPARQDDA